MGIYRLSELVLVYVASMSCLDPLVHRLKCYRHYTIQTVLENNERMYPTDILELSMHRPEKKGRFKTGVMYGIYHGLIGCL